MAQTMDLDGGARAAEREMVPAWRRLGMSWAAIDRNLGQRLGYALRTYGDLTPEPPPRLPPMATAEERAAIRAAQASARSVETQPPAPKADAPPPLKTPRPSAPAPTRDLILGHLRRMPRDSLTLADLCEARRKTISALLAIYRDQGLVRHCAVSREWSLTAAGLAFLQERGIGRG